MSDHLGRRIEALGGMSWEAAQQVLRNMRTSLYPEGAKRNSEVIAINTALALVPYLSAALERAERERDDAREALEKVRRDERERYAKIVEQFPNGTNIGDIAAAIRGGDT